MGGSPIGITCRQEVILKEKLELQRVQVPIWGLNMDSHYLALRQQILGAIAAISQGASVRHLVCHVGIGLALEQQLQHCLVPVPGSKGQACAPPLPLQRGEGHGPRTA